MTGRFLIAELGKGVGSDLHGVRNVPRDRV
jgi:hypothetical protein